MIILPKSNDTDLRQLLYDVQEGKIQLPEFQRDWTWDDNRIRGIIASLSQGYPMGAVMQLQYGNPDIKFKYRTITGVENKNVTPEYLVLDGQQRLTSIYQSTYSNQVVATKTDKGKSIKRFYYLDMNKCLDDNEDRLDAVISVPEDRKIKANFDRDIIMDLSTREFEYQLKMFPINIIYDNTQLMQWNFGYMMYYENDKVACDLLNRFQKEVVETILQYKLPVITLDKSTPREAVCKVFENVNTGGVPLTVFELVTATYATNEFDLRKDWEKCKKIIRAENEMLRTDLLDGIDEINFLTSVTLYTSYKNKIAGKSGTVSCKKKDVLNLPYEYYLENRDEVLEGYKIAREFYRTYNKAFSISKILSPKQKELDCQNQEVIISLLKMRNLFEVESCVAEGFMHMSLCEFLVAKSIIDALLRGGIKLIQSFSLPYRHFEMDFLENGLKSSKISKVS